ncbi:hypothetical protein MY10362_008533 [Beauveria mimosiformis]
MADPWSEAQIRVHMMEAVELAKDYDKDKTEPKRRAALEHVHNSFIYARDNPALKAELPNFIKLVSPYFDANVREYLKKL